MSKYPATVEHWEKFIRRIYDSEKCRIFITGSSSTLLSGEIASSLRGRTLTYEVFPLTFKEYLAAKNIKININSTKSVSLIKNAFSQYILMVPMVIVMISVRTVLSTLRYKIFLFIIYTVISNFRAIQKKEAKKNKKGIKKI